MKIEYFLLDSERSTRGKRATSTWDNFCADVLFPSRERAQKTLCPAWQPVVCACAPRRPKNSDVEAITLAVFDLDGCSPERLDHILFLVDRAEIACAVHSTWSHSEEKPSYRIVFPLENACDPVVWPTIWEMIRAAFSIPADEACRDLARLYFLPSHQPGTTPVALSTSGKFLVPIFFRDASLLSQDIIKRISNPESRELFRHATSGEPLTEQGKRDHTLTRLTGILAYVCRGEELDSALSLCESSILAMGPENNDPEHWLVEARRKLDRAVKNKTEKDAHAMAEVERAVLALTKHAPPSTNPPNSGTPNSGTPEIGSYTDEQVKSWAEHHGHTPESFPWIVQHGNGYYLFVDGKYRSPLPASAIEAAIPEALGRAPIAPSLYKANAKTGELTLRKPSWIVSHYGAVAYHCRASLSAQESRYDATTHSFVEAVCPKRRITPAPNERIASWLRLLAGGKAGRLMDWIAAVGRLERQSCALYLHGAAGTGKTLLAAGLARLWSLGGPSDLGLVLSGFQDGLTQCPLLLADEAIPAKPGVSTDLRRLIGSTTRQINRKYLPAIPLDGAIRLIITGNNERLLASEEDLTVNDLEAMASRFLIIDCQPDAARYLLDIGGPEVIQREWISGDGIAAHALYLQESRSLAEGGRFLVAGDPAGNRHHLASDSGIAPLVLEWLARHLANPDGRSQRRKGIVVGGGRLLVNAMALVETEYTWKEYLSSKRVPGLQKVNRALENLSIGIAEIDSQPYHVVRPDQVLAWATGVLPIQIIRERITQPLSVERISWNLSQPIERATLAA